MLGLGRSLQENGYPLQYSCLENSMDRGAWWAAAHGAIQSWTQLNNFHLHNLLDNKVSSLVSATAPANAEMQSCLPDLMHVEPLWNHDHVE